MASEELEVAEDLNKIAPIVSVPPEEPSVPCLLSDCRDSEAPAAGYSDLAPGLVTIALLRSRYTIEAAVLRLAALCVIRDVVWVDGIWWTESHWFIRVKGVV
jgi:hypothetical protein